ncbi:probable serine/threonine-protein kinase PBL5 [Rhodamnia argentea]|uniref:non-specific serine/threonine protein kinase n=1 Tax=Rhodamnia argentea TaxID=178133 RepID=A0A8B8PZX0_9MYRT|nr:probable serine/threonine-protein kinase PBL5 [Rhodamnia argentea]
MSSESQRVLVVEDAWCRISLGAIKCSLQRFPLHPGDKILLLAVLRKVYHPLGYQIKADSSAWMGSSQKFVQKQVERRKEEYTHADEAMEVSKQCESMKIELDIDVRGEVSLKEAVLKAAGTFKPTWVILDGKMKKDTDYLIAGLSCGVSIVKQNNTLGKLRAPKTQNPQKRHINISGDLIGGDEVKQTEKQSPQKQQTHDSSDLPGGIEQEPEIRNYICSICSNRRPKNGWKREFTHAELHAATDGFSTNNYQSENWFEVVFRGEMNGLKITVKQQKSASFQGDDKEFQSAVHMLSEVRHEHLVTLLGSCSDGNHRLLVYEFVCNGSLDQHLSSKNHRVPGKMLTWDQRIKIAMGAAKGLKYLHDNNIVHRNLRSNNILLTHDYKPLLGDFGLEMTLREDSDLSSETRIATIPYLAPEYADSGEVSQKTDCYSFGVILLQLITGLRSTDPSFGNRSIVGWARQLLREKNYPELIEHSLTDSYDVHQLAWVIRVAVKCLKKDPNRRISMDQVIHALSYIVEGKTLPVMRERPRPEPNEPSAVSPHNYESFMQQPSSPGGMDDLTTGLVPSITAKEYYRTTIAI